MSDDLFIWDPNSAFNDSLNKELERNAATDDSLDKRYVNKPIKRWDLKDQEEFMQVPVETLIDSKEFLGLGQKPCGLCGGKGRLDTGEREIVCGECMGTGEIRAALFPQHKRDIIDLWEARKPPRCATTAILQQGIGSGKTTAFCVMLWLMVAEVLTKVDPLAYYGLAKKGQGISFVTMSRNESLAKEVTFLTLLPYFDCPFFRDYFPPQVDLKAIESGSVARLPARLRFPKKVVIFPGTGSALSAIGYNLFGGGVDEANYLEVIDDSKKAVGGGRGYDAAEAMHTAIKARMKSRFDPTRLHREGKLPGMLVMFSNPRYAGDFTSRMEQRAKKDRSIFFRKRCTWESHPPERFCGEKFLFNVMEGRIIDPDDPAYEASMRAMQDNTAA